MQMESEPLLDSVIDIAGRALEAEDRYVLGCSTATGKKGGLLRIPNERYYQFVVCRGLLSRWDTVPEKWGHDAMIFINGEVSTVIEMKCWLTESGLREVRGIRDDVGKLQNAKSKSAIMVIFSVNPDGQTEQNIEFLGDHVPELKTAAKRVYSFPTIQLFEPDHANFWVCGWQIR